MVVVGSTAAECGALGDPSAAQGPETQGVKRVGDKENAHYFWHYEAHPPLIHVETLWCTGGPTPLGSMLRAEQEKKSFVP